MIAKYSVGIDISKSDFKACFLSLDQDQNLKIKASRAFDNTPKGFRDFKLWYNKFHKKETPLHFTMEATGVYGEHLSWYLFNENKKVHIVLPNRAKAYMISLGIKSKNDKIDAEGLAKMGAVQLLDQWKPISKNIYKLRSLTRHLEDLNVVKTSLNNQKQQFKLAMYTLKQVDRSLEKTIKMIDKQIQASKKNIEKAIEQDPVLKQKVACITSIKGVSTLTAAVIIAETNGFELIKNQKQLVSYAGYDIKENQSGSRIGKTRITKKGNSHIRRAMHLPAFNVVRYHISAFENLYQRVYDKTGIKMKGYVAVQSKLLRMIYTLWKKQEVFNPDFQTSGIQESKSFCLVDSKEQKNKTAESKDPAALDKLPCNQLPEALCSVS